MKAALVLVSLAALGLSGTTQAGKESGDRSCYMCTGYDPNSPPDPFFNNEHCPPASFDPTKVQNLTAHSDPVNLCLVMTIGGNPPITQRGFMPPFNWGEEKDTGTITGFWCDTDYCNT